MGRSKIEVYLSDEHKKRILAKAKKFDLSASDYMKLKALDLLKDEDTEDTDE